MYRSILRIDRSHPSSRQALADAQDMHRNLMRAFSCEENGSPRREHKVLYALMQEKNDILLYVTSEDRPDWSAVKGVSLYEDREPLCIDALKERFLPGTRLAFRLFASPTKKTPREGRLSARVFLKTPEERLGWLQRQAEKSGFSLLSVTEEKTEEVRSSRKGKGLLHVGTLFSGVLEITDRDAFWNAYCTGIGPGKAYGLGMLMVKRT